MRKSLFSFILWAVFASTSALAAKARFEFYAEEDEPRSLDIDSNEPASSLRTVFQSSEGGYREVLGVIDFGRFKKHFFVTKNDPPQFFFKYKNAEELAALQSLFAKTKIWGRKRVAISSKFDRKISVEMYGSLPPTEGQGYVSVSLSRQRRPKSNVAEDFLSPEERVAGVLIKLAETKFKPEFKYYYVVRDELSRGEDLPLVSRLLPLLQHPQQDDQGTRMINLFEAADNQFQKLSLPAASNHKPYVSVPASITLPVDEENGFRLPMLVERGPNSLVLRFFHEDDDQLKDAITAQFGELGGKLKQRTAEANHSLIGISRPSLEVDLQINAYDADLSRFLGETSERFITPERMTADFLSHLHRKYGLVFVSKRLLDETQVEAVKLSAKSSRSVAQGCANVLSVLSLK